MATKYVQSVANNKTRFSKNPITETEFSVFNSVHTHITDFNAGDIIPIYCGEVLPHDTFDVDLDFVIRQSTVLTPTLGQLQVDYFAFFVPHRIVNESWVNVQGENTSGSWTAPEVSLAPLYRAESSAGLPTESVQVPVGSLADYYGYPTQAPIPAVVLEQMHDLKIRGYLSIYNEYFRDQNYQPPIPFSKLNIYNGFFEPLGTSLTLTEVNDGAMPDGSTYENGDNDGSFGFGALRKAIAEGSPSDALNIQLTTPMGLPMRKTSFSALGKPLKANKLHDYFTSVLPSPQRGREVSIPLSGTIPVITSDELHTLDNPIRIANRIGNSLPPESFSDVYNMGVFSDGSIAYNSHTEVAEGGNPYVTSTSTNLITEIGQGNVSLKLSDIRFSAGVQQIYELLGRGGSRYEEFISTFFNLDIDNPFEDIPTCFGHVRRDLDLYQTAQTSATVPDSGSGAIGTAQGNLSAFGYTANGGSFRPMTFNEHGYVHVLAVVRHRNVYPALLTRDNFRLSQLDFYMPQLANISEQPVYTREINPFNSQDNIFGYQEPWSEYRYEPDRCSSFQRPGVSQSLAFWNYADDFDPNLAICDDDFLKSNTAEVVARTTALQDVNLPQFKAMFTFKIKKQRPMPIFSVPGMDIF